MRAPPNRSDQRRRAKAGTPGYANAAPSCVAQRDAPGFEAQERMRYTSDMQHWEYMTLDLLERKLTIEDLNRLGREGWEAVATVGSWGVERNFQHPVVLFKRPLANAPEGSSGV